MPQARLAIVSSIAAFVPLPDSPSYCASKSAILAYGLSLRSLLKPYDDQPDCDRPHRRAGIKVSDDEPAAVNITRHQFHGE